jgi:signal transduction histidine kinase/phage shock protein PspC (stress-responsive transcriptional regulator)
MPLMAHAELDSGNLDAPRRRARLQRSRRHRVLGGVAAGIADHLGIDVLAVRIAFVLLTLAAGFGAVVYGLVWLLAPVEAPGEPLPASRPIPRPGPGRILGAILVVIGVIGLLWLFGFWFGGGLAWPAVLAAIGFAVLWARDTDDGRGRWDFASMATPVEALLSGRISLPRVALGGALILGGMAILLAATTSLEAATSVVVAVLVTIGGLSLLAGPWAWNVGRQLIDERSSRIRSEARAEMAAHLHDSVLQTLALIQRAREPREMATLARTQERELRAWLYGRAPSVHGVRLRDAIDEMAGQIERRHQVSVETVVVGDAELDDRLRALVAACTEATLNAAKHSGALEISVYVEVEPNAVTAFIRDQGTGFDRDAVPSDRRGIADSIVARMERRGGSAEINARRGGGSEVILRLPKVFA